MYTQQRMDPVYQSISLRSSQNSYFRVLRGANGGHGPARCSPPAPRAYQHGRRAAAGPRTPTQTPSRIHAHARAEPPPLNSSLK